MENILQEVNLGMLVDTFNNERIDPDAVTALTDGDLIRLGVHTIGDRVRLRAACQRKVSESRNSATQVQSSVSQERATLFSLRSAVSSRSSSSRKKQTRGLWSSYV